MNLGVRAHDLETRPLEDLVREIAGRGLTSVQLALSKSLEAINTDLGCLSPGLAKYIGHTFAKHEW